MVRSPRACCRTARCPCWCCIDKRFKFQRFITPGKKELEMTDTAEHREKLMADLKLVVADAEALLQATAGQAGEGVAELRARVQASLSQAKDGLINVQHAVVEKARAT